MRSRLNMFSLSVIGLGMCAFIGGAYAATSTGRGANSTVSQFNRASATISASSQRMPTMPTLPNFTVGNTTVDLPSVTPSYPDDPDEPDEPDEPVPECPDGGVKDSAYTIDNCMDDILMCVNTGALPNGINDLFNEDLRNSIVNGMNLCATQVERCITEVRKNCSNIYRSSADVWIDFNSRKIQPAYYNFVLRKTGLTPNQAENTCLLLDVNTYGPAFAAVSNSGNVTEEYNIGVGAYNRQNGNVLIKNNPQGVELNYGNSGVDGQRGHYARWDATTAECWIRVAAYNKDTQIKNSWLFGAAGDDQPAEVWRLAGDTFTCNRDLFGFSLMNKTSTAAVVGIGGGAVVGAGVGAIAGHGARAFDCSNTKHREMLTEELRMDANLGAISEFLEERISPNIDVMTKNQCEGIVNLYSRYAQVKDALKRCNTVEKVVVEEESLSVICDTNYKTLEECFSALVPECAGKNFDDVNECVKFVSEEVISGVIKNFNKSYQESVNTNITDCWFWSLADADKNDTNINCPEGAVGCKESFDIKLEVEALDKVFNSDIVDLLRNGEDSNIGKSIGIGLGVGVGAGGLATAITAFVERSNISCHVGDGLAQVGYGKSYKIEDLKDFYVKWNLNLPDNVTPTGLAVDCESWKRACGTIKDLNQCKAAQMNYKPAEAATVTLVPTACTVSGSVCVENYPVAKSYGACE